jgi:hypothetical protein
MRAKTQTVIPDKPSEARRDPGSIAHPQEQQFVALWIPAFAGMTAEY